VTMRLAQWWFAPYPPERLAVLRVAVGYRFRITGPLFAILVLALMTYRSSWGMVFHTENLPVLHLLIVAVAPAAAAGSIDVRRHAPSADRLRGGFGWPVRLMCVVTVLAYSIAGWSKWQRVGIEWFLGDALRSQIAYDNLRKISFGAAHSPLGVAFLSFFAVGPQ